jgi:hypothetical protein
MPKQQKNNKKQLADSIIGKIDADHLKPESKNSLMYKSFSLYIVFALAIAALSLITVMALNTFKRNLFLEYSFGGPGPGGVIHALPWGLIIFTVLALGLIIFLVGKTEFGYQYRKLLLIPAGLIFLSLMTGLIYAGGVRHGIDDVYRIRNLEDSSHQRFRGKVIEINQPEIKLEDATGYQTAIIIDDDTKCRPDDCADIKLNMPIAGWAEEEDDGDLIAKEIQTRGPRQGPPPKSIAN